jgi:hypothetical protein
MRFLISALLVIPLTSCFPTRPLAKQSPAPSVETEKISPVILPPSPPPSSPASPPRVVVREINGITFVGIAFDSRNHRLVVADQPNGPGSQYADSAAAAQALGGIAAVNAGFFTPEGSPLGLVVSSGKISGTWNTASSLGSGIWYENTLGGTAITRREKVGRSGALAMRELIQAGPLLVENGRAVSGLEATKSSARILLLWDGGTRWWIGHGSPCTLAALGQALASSQPAGWVVRDALNLDGGRSADLWISDRVPDGPILRRPPWNRSVRNFLVLVGKS